MKSSQIKAGYKRGLILGACIFTFMLETLLGASVVNADLIQHQSYQRASQDEECVTQPGETPWQANWGPNPNWSPSWEQWANNGAGGWVCSRSITWAKSPKIVKTNPGVPRIVSVIVGDSRATILWDPPESAKEFPVISYTASATALRDDSLSTRAFRESSLECTTASTSCTVTGLTNGTSYTFTVTATTSAGTSAESAASDPVTPSVTPTPPGAPTGVSATAGNARVTVSWTAPTNVGGSAITGYTATSSPGGKTCETGTLTCVINGLTNGTPYTFTVTATNTVGTSAASDPSTAVTPILSCATGGDCSLGDIGPGGGLVFFIDLTRPEGSRYFEMAPKNAVLDESTSGIAWITGANTCYAIDSSTADQNCQENNLYSGTEVEQAASTNLATGIGMGSANTAAIVARMDAGSVASTAYAAGLAKNYRGGGLTDWFMPSRDEINAMCNYSRNPTNPPTGICIGSQDVTFGEESAYGFALKKYWSSSQFRAGSAWSPKFADGGGYGNAPKSSNQQVRPIRSF